MSGSEHTANLLGALALAVTDRMTEQLRKIGASPTAAAALSALHGFLEAPTIEALRRVLGLTHSGAVRLVDRLERDGHLRRRSGPDARSTALSLTPAGRRLANRLAAARHRVLTDTLGALPAADQRALDRLIAALLAGMPADTTRWTCRMCDPDACGRLSAGCPRAGHDRSGQGR